MVHSMTAFSRQQVESEWGSLTWEIRSVNHRYLEPSIRLPENFRDLENSVRKQLREKLHRGKVECQLKFQALENKENELIFWDQDLLNMYFDGNFLDLNNSLNYNIYGDQKASKNVPKKNEDFFIFCSTLGLCIGSPRCHICHKMNCFDI